MRKLGVLLSAMFLTVPTVASFGSLTTTYTASGNVGAEVAAYASPGGPTADNLVLGSIPVGATVLQAYLYANNYFSDPGASVVFNGNALGPQSAYAVDGGFYSYRFDVTSLITGNGSYSASYSGPDNTYGLALAVVFSDPSLPVGQVFINDGAIDLLPSDASTSFAGLTAGAGTLWIHTAADDEFSSGEQIQFNGNTVGGPIDANLGPYASLFALGVTAAAGTNTASIIDPGDQFGWDLAVLQVRAGVVPEPGSIVLIGSGLGLIGLRLACRARRRVL